MAIRKNTKSKSTNKTNGAKGSGVSVARKVLFCLTVLLIISLLAFAVYAILQIPSALMLENPRFELRRIEIHSSGYWHGRGRELASRLGISEGDNLFAMNVGEIRKSLLNIMNIERGDVQLVLPDMIVFNITERVPRASILGSLVVDEYGNQFKKTESTAAGQRLPVISGFRSGKDIKGQLAPALALIMTVIREYKDFVIESISVANEHYLDVVLVYRDHSRFNVEFPVGRSDYSDLMQALNNAIIQAHLSRSNPTKFNLRFRGQVLYE